MAYSIRAVRSKILSAYDTFIFDADGVLWLGSTIVPGAPDVLNSLIDLGKQVIIITNNSTKTVDDYVKKTQTLGFHKIRQENIVSAAIVTAHELAKKRQNNLPIYLIGSPGLQRTLAEAGIESFGPGPDPIENYSNDNNFIMNVDVSRPISAVVCSFDLYLNYVKIMKAANYLKNPNVDFIVTNEDYTFPGSVPGVVVPGSGIVSAAVKAVTGREPVVMGKPHIQMFNFISSKYNIDPKKTLMVGDRCDTDIWFGTKNGLDTMLVCTGINNMKDVERFATEGKYELVPKMYAQSVKVLIDDDGKEEEYDEEKLQDGINCVA